MHWSSLFPGKSPSKGVEKEGEREEKNKTRLQIQVKKIRAWGRQTRREKRALLDGCIYYFKSGKTATVTLLASAVDGFGG